MMNDEIPLLGGRVPQQSRDGLQILFLLSFMLPLQTVFKLPQFQLTLYTE